MNNVAQNYARLFVEGSSPVGLVVALYDNALKSLHRARRAIETNDVELRTRYLNHVLCIVAHLQGTLDLERGGEVASTLERFYSYARAAILEVSLTNSKEKLADLASHFYSLREAWQTVENQVSEVVGAGTGRA